jgi:hypothetical protein
VVAHKDFMKHVQIKITHVKNSGNEKQWVKKVSQDNGGIWKEDDVLEINEFQKSKAEDKENRNQFGEGPEVFG